MTLLQCLPSLLILILVSASVTLGEEANITRIHNASELISFSNNVNNGTNYAGTTVYLESDIDFSEEEEALSGKFEPIGKNDSYSFFGTFDGQGHTISNLGVKSPSRNVGLFGVTKGAVQNIVIDSTCFITSNVTGNDNVHVGSVIGFYNPGSEGCSVSNIVNMANATFEGNTTGDSGFLFLGGIIGYIPSLNNYNAIIKNCANYGSLIHSGTANGGAYIGGIVGQSSFSSSSTTPLTYILNSLNYGSVIISDGTSKTFYIGGIVGHSSGTAITNCVSAGGIASPSGTTGSIVGKVESITNITHCLWTSDTRCGRANGTGTPSSITGSSLVTLNTTTVDELNEYATDNGWSKWLFNKNNHNIAFKVNNNAIISLTSKLILLPDLVAGRRNFTGWYKDPYRDEPFQLSEITCDTALYGGWDNYIVTFDANGGDVAPAPMRVTFNTTYGTLPTPSRTGHTFTGWFNEDGENVTSDTTVTTTNDHTLYAQWVPNNYTVAFDANGGYVTSTSVRVTFNTTYGTLPTPSRTGHIFIGWFNENKENVTSDNTVTITSDHTLYAQWEEIPTNYVEIVFETKDLTKDKVEEIIRKYTNETFTIIEFETGGESDETKVTIKFNNPEAAENFIEQITTSSDNGIIKRIGFISEDDVNSSSIIHPIIILFSF